MCGADAAALRRTRSRRYKEYALQRTLGMKAVLTRATTEAGVLDAKTRCAIGRKLADPSSGTSLFHAYAKNADAAMDAFVRGVEEDLRDVADERRGGVGFGENEEFLRRTRDGETLRVRERTTRERAREGGRIARVARRKE